MVLSKLRSTISLVMFLGKVLELMLMACYNENVFTIPAK